MPTGYSMVVVFETGNGTSDEGIGSFWVKGRLEWNHPHAGISTTGNCYVYAEGGKQEVGAGIWETNPLELEGSVSPTGVFTTKRGANNPVGAPMLVGSRQIASDGTGRYVYLMWETTTDDTYPNKKRTISGEVYLKYYGYYLSGPIFEVVQNLYTTESTRIPFTISVYKAP